MPAESTSNQSDPQEGLNETGIALVCVSGGGDLDVIRSWCDTVIQVSCPAQLWQNVFLKTICRN